MMDYWYSYAVFRHTRQQNYWAIENRTFFDDGEWPPIFSSPKGEFITDEYDKQEKKWVEVVKQVSTYIEVPIGKRQVKHEAYFVNPALVIAEIETRLETTGEAGEALLDEIGTGISMDGLSGPALRALKYISDISGMRRRRQTYAQWRADAKRRNKNHRNVVFTTPI